MENPFEVQEDQEILLDYLDGIEEKYRDVEQTLLHWRTVPASTEPLHKLFRLLHSVKGDAKMCHLEPISQLTHTLEEVMSRVREGCIQYNEPLLECIMLTMDRLLHMSREAIEHSQITTDGLPKIIDALAQLAATNVNETNAHIANCICALTGKLTEQKTAVTAATVTITAPQEFEADRDYALNFARTLSERIDNRFPHWQKRSEFLLPMVIGMNALAMNKVNFYQLEMALYIHDFGMLFFREESINKKEKFDDVELALLHNHPTFGADLLQNFAHWDDASTMVAQHHERFDGLGYPNKLKGEEICDGALILAICDAYYSMTHARPDRADKRSIMRAITEINNCAGNQFCPKWVEKFNCVAKMQYLAGALTG